MPFHPGILLSALLLILCLGINLTQYPAVRCMLHEPSKDTAAAPATPSKQSVPASSPAKEKASKVYKPIQSDSKTAPSKTELPKAESPKPEQPKIEPPKQEPSKESFQKELSKSELPKSELPKKEPTKPETRKELPKELPRMEFPKPEPPKTEPVAEKPKEKETKEKESIKALPKVEPPKETLPKVSPKENPEAAFLPIVPTSLEKEYQNTKDQNNNQFAMFAQQNTVPTIKNDTMQPSHPSPAFADLFAPPQPTIPVQTLVQTPIQKPKPKAPTAVWNTIDSALERPLISE